MMDKMATKFDRDAFKWGKKLNNIGKREMQTFSPSNFKPCETFLF